jgi:hypothetical protein
VLVVNRVLQIQPSDEFQQRIERQDLGRQQAYRHWLEAARLYGRALCQSPLVRPDEAAIDADNIRILATRIEQANRSELDGTLRAAYEALQPGDLVVVDVPRPIGERDDRGRQRDLIGRALFKAGVERPMIWAGRAVLAAENRAALINRVLTSSALGAGPRYIPGTSAPLDPRPEQIMAMARRSALAPPNERPLLLSVVMPVYNEKRTFHDVMELLLAKTIPGMTIEICLVESNSTDGTRDDVLRYAQHPRVRLLLEDKPSGKGHAVRKGLELATGDIVLIQDADLEYDLDDYEKLLEPIRSLEVSFVLGSRHPDGEESWQIRKFGEQRIVSHVMNLGHLLFTGYVNTMFGQKLRDPFTMYKVFRRDCVQNVRFECNRFDFDLELVGKLIRNGFQPKEIGIQYKSRSFEEGKKVSMFGDPPTWIRAGFRHRFSRLHVWP